MSLRVYPSHLLLNRATRSLFAQLSVEVPLDCIGDFGAAAAGTRMVKFAYGWKSILFRRLRTSVEQVNDMVGGDYVGQQYRELLRSIDALFLSADTHDVLFYTAGRSNTLYA